MKVKDLVRKLYGAIIKRDANKEKKVWSKILKKSLKHKHTEAVR